VIDRPGRRFHLLAVAVAALALAPGMARADEAKVEVNVDVVHLSNQGNEIVPPSLSEMKKKFDEQGLVFSSYRQLSSSKLVLELNKAQRVKLPNAKTVPVKLVELKEGVAKIAVEVKGTTTMLSLGREGSANWNVGGHKGGQLVLVISPITRPDPEAHPASALPPPEPAKP
jgi:hypothetical protein